MPRSTSSNVEPLVLSDCYFTSGDLNVLESALTAAMVQLEETGAFDADEDTRPKVRLRLAAAIMRRASAGERNPAVLKRVALSNVA